VSDQHVPSPSLVGHGSPVVTALRVAPATLLRGDGAVEALAARLRSAPAGAAAIAGPGRGGTVLIVYGSIGYPLLRPRLDAALDHTGVAVRRTHHVGPCHASAIATVAAEARRSGVAWVLGVGGGRVLDTAKGAAHAAGLPFAALPTSPATCSATAATVVVYDTEGRHQAVHEDGPSPALSVLDPALLAAAPDRLLAAGIADAWAKVHEVRLTGVRSPWASATSRAALALLADLATLLADHALEAVAAGPAGTSDASLLPQRRLVAEAVVALPGLIGGLAGPDAKLALAHPLHDALTLFPEAHASLHGEKVAFGTLVQIRLAGRDGCARGEAERRAAMRAEAAMYAGLGLVCHLEALGCGAARTPPGLDVVVDHVLTDAAVAQALPSLTAAALSNAICEVDRWLRDQGVPAGRHRRRVAAAGGQGRPGG
jgi:glycerol dehydrogenase-like iron-containing ADH family enzyme